MAFLARDLAVLGHEFKMGDIMIERQACAEASRVVAFGTRFITESDAELIAMHIGVAADAKLLILGFPSEHLLAILLMAILALERGVAPS